MDETLTSTTPSSATREETNIGRFTVEIQLE